MMHEYLVTYGLAGDFARYRGEAALRRGDRVVIRSGNGLELGTILCPATDRHAGLLPGAGELVRQATADDEAKAQRLQERSRQLFEDAQQLCRELNLTLALLDAEITFDERQATLQVLAGGDCQPLVKALSKRHDLTVVVQDLAAPVATGCGKPDCGQGQGGCSSCSSGGGCGSGCGTPELAGQVADHFARLRRQMEERHVRTPLL